MEKLNWIKKVALPYIAIIALSGGAFNLARAFHVLDASSLGYIAGIALCVATVVALASYWDIEINLGKHATIWGLFFGVVLGIVGFAWEMHESQHEAKVAVIVAKNPEIGGLLAEKQAREEQQFVLGADDEELMLSETRQVARHEVASQLADDIRAGNGEDVKAWKEQQRQAMLAPKSSGLIDLTRHGIVIEEGPDSSSEPPKSFSEDLLSVPWWQAGIFLFFTFVVMTVATWLIVTSFINTIFGKGVKEVKEGLEGWKWFRAWGWYIFDRFIVRWSGKFAAVALVVYVIVATRSWYFPAEPLPGSVMWETMHEETRSTQVGAAATAGVNAPKSVAARENTRANKGRVDCRAEKARIEAIQIKYGSTVFSRAGLSQMCD